MAINNVMLAALKALSYSDSELEKTYKLERKFDELTHPNLLKPFYKIWDRTVTVDERDIPVRVFFPSSEGSHRILIFFHGGGFVKGNIEKYTRVCANMANITDSIVLSVDYRLAPEHPFPAGLDDCYAVAKEVILHSEFVESGLNDITLIGDSAGATLAAAVSQLARDKGEFQVARQILLYPLTYNDHDCSSPFPSVIENGTDYLLTSKRIREYIKLYIKDENDLENPYFAPLLAKHFENLPETLVITAAFDPLRDEGEAYGEALLAAGNRVEIHRLEDTIHGFISLPPIFETVKQCYSLINGFLTRRDER